MMSKDKKKLPGDYIAGFTDGEGCFAIKFRRDKKQNKLDKKIKEYFYWGAEFAIVLRNDEINILEQIKHTLDCGSIVKQGEGELRYTVQNPKDLLQKIIPFYERNRLRAKKYFDFLLWKKAVEIIADYRRKKINTEKGRRGFIKVEIPEEKQNELFLIRKRMVSFKSKRKEDFRWGKERRRI